jgi:hypothetical protein
MNALELVARDMARSKRTNTRYLVLAGALGALGIGLGIGLRRDLLGLDTAGAALAIGLMLAAVFGVAIACTRRAALLIATVLTVIATTRLAGGGMAISYSTSGVFWHEIFVCVTKGLATAVLALGIVAVFVARVLPLPSRRALLVASILPSAAGLLMLTVHCPSENLGHLALGHWLATAAAFPIAVLVTRAVLRKLVAPVVDRPGLANAFDAMFTKDGS